MTIYQAVISIKHHSFDVIAVFAAINLDSKLKHFLTAPISIQKDKIIKLAQKEKQPFCLLKESIICSWTMKRLCLSHKVEHKGKK
jgi:hypothetical protein